LVTLEQEILNTIEEVKRIPNLLIPTLIKLTENKKFKELKSEVNQSALNPGNYGFRSVKYISL